MVRENYGVKVPFAGSWREVLNTDADVYGGSNVGNGGWVPASQNGDQFEIRLTLPPLAALFLVPEH
jgi:1,4-alpha-glucan branching enzyme